MSDLANQGSETLIAVTNFLNNMGNHMEEAVRELGRVLEMQAKTKDVRALGRYIALGGKLTIVEVDDRIVNQLQERLRLEHIGYLEGDIKGPNAVIFVPTNNLKRLKEIECEILKENGLNTEKMSIDALCKANDNKNSNIIELRGLSEEEMLSLIKECNGICENFKVGTEKVATNNYNIAISEEKAFSMNPKVKDFAYAYLISTIDIHGDRADIKADMLIQNNDFLEKLGEIKVRRGEESKYILSNDRNKYIQMTDGGFTMYSYVKKGNEVKRTCLESVENNSPKYMERLTARAMELGYCGILQESEAFQLLNDKHQDKEREKISQIRSDERNLANKINEIVKERMAKDPKYRNESNCSILLSGYVDQAKSLLDDLSNNINPRGLTHQQVEKLYSFMDNAAFDSKKYRDCKKVFDRFDTDRYKGDERIEHYERKYANGFKQPMNVNKEVGKDRFKD